MNRVQIQGLNYMKLVNKARYNQLKLMSDLVECNNIMAFINKAERKINVVAYIARFNQIVRHQTDKMEMHCMF